MRGALHRGALVVAALAALAMPTQAVASIDVSTVSGEIRIESTNDVLGTSIDYLPSNAAGIPDKFRISEAGGNATTSDGDCETSGSSIVLCEDNAEDKVVVEFGSNGGFVNLLTLVGQLPDRFTSEIALGNGSDTVDATDGTDTVTTSNTGDVSGDTIDTYDGNDTITTADGADLINGGNDADVIVANDGNNVINGGESAADDAGDGPDNITGGDLFDLISGGLGNDTINGGGGPSDTADDDQITGDDGNDTVNGGGGEDEIDGGDDTDDLNGDAGTDEILGGEGTDTLEGGEGGDTLDGQNGTDTLNGDGGDDTLLNSDGADAFNGGADTAGDAAGDEVDYTPTSAAPIRVTIDGTANDGRNCPSTCEGDNVGTTVENVTGDSSSDTLIGSTAGNILDGAGGGDTLAGGPGGASTDGNDRYIGGAGTDLVTFGAITGTSARTAALDVDIDGTADDGAGAETDDVETDIENVTGGAAGDTITGSTLQNQLRGGAGTASDTLSGGADNDTLFGGDGTNTNADGADVFNGGAQGASGDTVSYAGRTAAVIADLDGAADDGAAGENDDINTDIENLTGGEGGDTLTGNGSDNLLSGLGGNDTLAGGTSAGDDGSDFLVGNAGTEDTVTYASRTNSAAANDLDLTLDTNPNDGAAGELDDIDSTVENLIGGAADDDITGNSQANDLSGGGGDDELRGGTSTGADGADTFAGGTGGTVGGQNSFLGDIVNYELRSGNVTISIGGGTDGAAGENDAIGDDIELLEGGEGDDIITGGPLGNFLTGNDGNDTLAGGPGGDASDGLDHFIGGADLDTVSYLNRTDPITAIIDDPSVIVAPNSSDNDNITSSIENLTGGSGDDILTGNDSNNQLIGGFGNDTLAGGQPGGADGADSYLGGSGANIDTVTYAHRSDSLNVDIDGGADDTDGDNVQLTIENLTGGSGNDTLTGNSAANVLSGGPGDDTLAGGSSATSDGLDAFNGGTNGVAGDTVSYAVRTDNLTLSIGGAPDGPEGDSILSDVENVEGGLGNDTVTGSSASNTLRGGDDGDDTLAGGTSAGPDGADVFRVGTNVGSNTDTVTYAVREDVITADIGGGADDVDGDDISSDADILIGGSNDDALTGDADANTLEGGGGEDTLTALGGIDTVRARDGFADIVDCGTEADTAILDEGTLDTQTECETLDQPPLQPPQTTILTGPDNPTTRRTARFTFSADEESTFTCKLDAAAPVPCDSPEVFRGLTRTRHKMVIRATDLAGAADPTPAIYRWRITTP